jgi:hypothetical protein
MMSGPLYGARLCRYEYRLAKTERPLKLIPATFIQKWLPTLDTLRNLFGLPNTGFPRFCESPVSFEER